MSEFVEVGGGMSSVKTPIRAYALHTSPFTIIREWGTS